MARMYRTLPYQGAKDLRQVSEVVNNAMSGKINNSGIVTLTNGVTSTTLTDERLGYDSCIFLSPTTANASVMNPYISAKANGSCTISHTASSNADLIFDYIIIG